MQCIWQNLARLAIQSPVNCAALLSIRSLGRNIGPPYAKPVLRTLSSTTGVTSSLAYFPPPSIQQQNHINPALLESEPNLTGPVLAEEEDKPLTSVQLARAAAHAVHLCLHAGNLSDAFLIVNSVRYAGFGDDAKKLPAIKSFEKFKAVALVFDKDVSPRLPSHTLLHGLVRLNLPNQASKLAGQMMSAGIPIRCKTLEAILHNLRENSAPSFNGKRTSLPVNLLESSDVLTLRPSMLGDRGTKFAIDLLILARRSRQRRSGNMFKILIALCIVNGEIIVASLLFGVLLRDWQARELTANLVPENCPPKLHPKTPFPVYSHLRDICDSVTCTLASDKSDMFAFRASLQALANLATMLDQQAIAYHNINPLITALHKCPRVQDTVWINNDLGNPKRVVAYKYFHDVLHRLILSLPTHPPVQDERKKVLPPLDIYSYNCLLHYALRHRHSTALAEIILNHMMHERHNPLEPDTTTLNIITRSGTLLRDSEIANLALSKLKGRHNSFMSAPRTSESILTPLPLRSLLNIPEQKDDKYTLTARIAHLTATGQLQIVIDSLPILFPTLTCPGHEYLSRDELDDFAKRHEQDLRRSVLLGPVVFTCILNALQKAGRTGLAEKVWRWARLVEKMSWTVKVKGQFRPWCLPVLAYTIMIKLYAEEVKKAHFYRKEVDRKTSATIQKPAPSPRNVGVIGWGKDSVRGADFPEPETIGSLTRSAMGRYCGMRMYRLMRNSADAIREKISERRDQGVPIYISKRELEIPEPDARFFNAILDIVGRHPHAPPRKVRYGPGHYRRQYRRRYLDYVWRGVLERSPNPDLLEVGRDMMAAGFEIPLLFQKFFVGRPEVGGSLDQVKPRMERDRRVFAAKKVWNPREQVGKVLIPVQNTRTLDLSSKRWRRRKRTGAASSSRAVRRAPRREMAWKIGDNKLTMQNLCPARKFVEK